MKISRIVQYNVPRSWTVKTICEDDHTRIKIKFSSFTTLNIIKIVNSKKKKKKIGMVNNHRCSVFSYTIDIERQTYLEYYLQIIVSYFLKCFNNFVQVLQVYFTNLPITLNYFLKILISIQTKTNICWLMNNSFWSN